MGKLNIIIPLKDEKYKEYIDRILSTRNNEKDKENYQEKEANSKAERMRIRKERAEKCGFKNHDEVIDWLKAGNCVYTACGNIDYNANDNLFYWTRQVSDEYDCNFWWVTDKYTEEEIRAHYNNLKEKYGSDLYDEFGYLISPHKKYLIL